MRDWEIDLIKSLLLARKPAKVLEWGSGYGTLYFSGLLGPDVHWTAIEHDKSWHNIISYHNVRKNVSIELVEANNENWSDPAGDGSYEDLIDYISFPKAKKTYDFIIIDGRGRLACLKKAKSLIKENGIIVLHDANREHYHEAFKDFSNYILFTSQDYDSGGVWIGGSNKLNLDKKNDRQRSGLG